MSKPVKASSCASTSPLEFEKNLIRAPNVLNETHSKKNLQPRVCFISLFYLFQEWRFIPDHVLHNSLIILDCSRSLFMRHFRSQLSVASNRDEDDERDDSDDVSNVIYDELKIDINQMTSSERILSQLHITTDDHEFVAMIFQKEARGSVLWLDSSVVSSLDKRKLIDNVCTLQQMSVDTDIDAKWLLISQWLEISTDPVTGDTYNPIQLSHQWWENTVMQQILSIVRTDINVPYCQLISEFRYSDDIKAVGFEISEFQNNFKPCAEILHQSNPTLIPMMKWNENGYNRRVALIDKAYNIVRSSPSPSPPATKRMLSSESISADEAQKMSDRVNFGLEDDDSFVYLR